MDRRGDTWLHPYRWSDRQSGGRGASPLTLFPCSADSDVDQGEQIPQDEENREQPLPPCAIKNSKKNFSISLVFRRLCSFSRMTRPEKHSGEVTSRGEANQVQVKRSKRRRP